MREVASIGPAGASVRRAFAPGSQDDHRAVASMWGQNEAVTSMRSRPNVHIVPFRSRADLAKRYWEGRSRLLLTTNLYMPTNTVVAVWIEHPTVGSRWNNCHVKQEDGIGHHVEWALCVYLNSTLGLLSVLGGCTGSARLNRPQDDSREPQQSGRA